MGRYHYTEFGTLISYIDEAGTFVSKGASENSWCTVACYSHPEFEKRKLAELLKQLKLGEATLQGMEEDSKLKESSAHIKYIFWLGLAICTLMIVIRQLK